MVILVSVSVWQLVLFLAAPSVPLIDTERCTVMWDSATLRWSSAKQTREQNYTLEYCRQYELEGEGLRWVFCFLEERKKKSFNYVISYTDHLREIST